MFQAPRSKIHCTHLLAPFACCALPVGMSEKCRRALTISLTTRLRKLWIPGAVSGDLSSSARLVSA
ncbi:hypothetical protein PR002_g17878 [Phytophthora rubi]|uniref:Uncharacterized protein n=1 Tax=Phytophthora rubi TaxID=129364 RepID=A0A6A3K390_9STRA|nr:hypothetical protein PR002_g17878 [Phytophthora rubi]